jgi:hypothetical protein
MESDLRLIVLEAAQLGWSFFMGRDHERRRKERSGLDWIGVLLLASAFTWKRERES